MKYSKLSSDLFYLAVKESKNKDIFKNSIKDVTGKPIRKQNTNNNKSK